MALKKQIEDKLNVALKAKDKNTYPTLRLIVSAIKDAEIAGRTNKQKEIKDSDIISLLKKMIKQRTESSEVYKKAGRNELLENEEKEIEVISTFLPRALNICANDFYKLDISLSAGIEKNIEFNLQEAICLFNKEILSKEEGLQMIKNSFNTYELNERRNKILGYSVN